MGPYLSPWNSWILMDSARLTISILKCIFGEPISLHWTVLYPWSCRQYWLNPVFPKIKWMREHEKYSKQRDIVSVKFSAKIQCTSVEVLLHVIIVSELLCSIYLFFYFTTEKMVLKFHLKCYSNSYILSFDDPILITYKAIWFLNITSM